MRTHAATWNEELTPAPAVRELIGALRRETEVIGDLRAALVRQRAAVAANDAVALDAGVDAIVRILEVMEDARARRREALELAAGDAALHLGRLEDRLGFPLPEALWLARETFRSAVREVVRDLEINRAVLRRALEAGEAFLQSLFSAALEPEPGYGPAERRGPGESRALLVNRTV